jgi:hypothetical protein
MALTYPRAVTRKISFSGLIQRNTPSSRLLRHTRGCGGSILTRILTGTGSGEDCLKLSVQVYSFAIISPWSRAIPFIWTKPESPSPKDELCQVWLNLAQWFWKRRFLNDPPHFYIFCDYLPFEENQALIWTNLNSLHSRINCIKFDWIWLAGSGEDLFLFSVYFYSFATISTWRGAIPFI